MATPIPPAPIGRRTVLTAEVIADVVDNLNKRAYLKDALMAAGVGVSTGHRWLSEADGPAPKAEDYRRAADHIGAVERWELCREFRDAVARARATAKVDALERIRQAGESGDWRAEAWWLERAFPRDYGPHARDLGEEGEEDRQNVGDARERIAGLLDRVGLPAEE